MNVTPLLNTPCTIVTVTEGAPDIYGDPTETTSSAATLCWVDRRGSSTTSEQVGAQDWQTDTLDLFLPPSTAVTGRDRVVIDSVTYEFVGEPHNYTHPRTGEAVYVAAVIQRVD